MNENRNFIGNLCLGTDAPHGEACVNEIHLRGWAAHCECACHQRNAENQPIVVGAVELLPMKQPNATRVLARRLVENFHRNRLKRERSALIHGIGERVRVRFGY